MKYNSLAAARAAIGIEQHGLIVPTPIFESGLTAPANHKTSLMPADVTLKASSMALDHGLVLANLNDGYRGAAPDLGALERGCPLPIYGVRPAGMDETNEPIGCAVGSADGGLPDSGPMPPPDANMGGAGGSGGNTAGASGVAGSGAGIGGAGTTENQSGCGCTTARSASRGATVLLCLLALGSRRRGDTLRRKRAP